MANGDDLVQTVSGGGLSVREERRVRCSLVCRDGDGMLDVVWVGAIGSARLKNQADGLSVMRHNHGIV